MEEYTEGLVAKATGIANGADQCNQCQCDCYECAGGDTSDDY